MKNVTVSLDDATYRNARRRAAENDRSLSSVVREVLQEYGAQESEAARHRRSIDEAFAEIDALGLTFDPADRLSRYALYERGDPKSDRTGEAA